MTVAVLFARTDSVYKTLPDVEVYDIERDARTYDGPWPVVAHPPCRAWGKLHYFAKPRPDERNLALHGVLDSVCRRYDVPLLAARGYPSVSIVRELVMEHLIPALANRQQLVILHLGDHDPSGIDMTRDLIDRIGLFMPSQFRNWHLDRIALTMSQIEEHNPPPNPAKTTDARFSAYQAEFGDESWELDAL